MGEYDREQRNQLSRVIANSGSRQLKEFVDNRACATVQKNEAVIIQRLTMADNEVLKRAWNEHQDNYYGYLSEQGIVPDSDDICVGDHGETAQFKVMQCARVGNTISGPKDIDGKKVCFLRDAKGNIDFSNPHQGYIGNPLGINYTDANSKVNVSHAVTHYGTDDRYRHFKYANEYTPGTIKGKGGNSPDGWTWHHLTDKHYMHLVKRAVHRSFGHNGGVYLW